MISASVLFNTTTLSLARIAFGDSSILVTKPVLPRYAATVLTKISVRYMN